jgi:hypothetical protein
LPYDCNTLWEKQNAPATKVFKLGFNADNARNRGGINR